MRNIVIGIMCAFAAWAGYWFYGQSAHAENTADWFETQRDLGWIAEFGDLEVQGFPNRFDTILSDVALADPKTGWAWEAPKFQLLSLSYRPNHIIAVFPEKHIIRTPDQMITVTHEVLRGSAVFEPGSDYALERSSFEGKGIALQGFAGDPVRIETGQLATRRTEEGDHGHQVAMELIDVDLGRQVLALLKGTGTLPTKIDEVSFRATADFDGPWDRPSLAASGPDLRNLDIEDLTLNWADMRLRAAGEVAVDRLGYPSGALSLRAENWQRLVDIAVANGVVPSELKSGVVSALELIARLSGTPDDLDVKLSFSNRTAFLGPIPIGPAPIIWPVQRQ